MYSAAVAIPPSPAYGAAKEQHRRSCDLSKTPSNCTYCALSLRTVPSTFDESYDLHENINTSIPQRQQRQHRPAHQPPSARTSSSSGSTRTLRRTPRLEQQRTRRPRTSPFVAVTPRSPTRRPIDPVAEAPPSSEGDGSTTPRATSRGSAQSAFWPRRTTRISKRTAAAILYALEEFLRKPNEFTPDYVEENASMSDLLGGPSSAGGGNGRAQNGGATSGPVPVPQPHYRVSGVRTPTDIMKTRQEREARKRAAESESRQRARNEEQSRPQQEGPTGTERRDDPAGVAPIESRRRSGDPTSTRRSGETPGNRTTTDRRSGERRSGGDPKIINQPQDYKSTAIGPVIEQSNTANVTSIPQSSRRRATSLSQDQPRPVPPSNRAASATHNTQQQQPQTRNTSTAPMEARSQPNPSASNIPQPQTQNTQETNGGTSQQRGTTSSFPHAFERWETLSSHWEGLTSYWIRRLQNNGDEMSREPLSQQMARQVTDLSAAGANLFHAVVELQRLRASSERKFQRWFFDTRAEQERAREVQARLENELRSERQARAEAVAELNKPKADQYAAYQDQSVIDQMLKDVKSKDMEVKEMRRELQISKEEARRAWEELGRREQEERDRTTSLRAGEPTLVGGVQVVPMLQGAPSRQTSANRPSTRDGPLPSAPSALSGPQSVESPLDEPGVTHYDPARSETDTDPFTENGRGAQQPAHAPIPQQQTSNGSSAAVQAARSASLPTQQSVNSVQPQPTTSTSAGGGTYLRYGPGGATSQPPASSFYQHEGSSLLPEGEQVRTTEPDDRSFVPSNDDTFSEEEFEYDGNGNVRRDAQGNPIVYGRGTGSEDSDEDDVQDQLDRERMYSERYGSGLSGVEYGSGPTSTAGPRGQSGRTTGQVYGGPLGQEGSTGPVDYSGSAYGSGIGWEAVPRHHHPTRLSDVLEEDERSRTSLSRASQTSRGLR